MSNRKYYYLIAGLPDIIPDDRKLTLSSVQLRDYFREGLHKSDYELVMQMYMPWDHDNLINLLYKEKKDWDERGNYSQELLEQLTDRKQFGLNDFAEVPDYITQFLELYHNNEEEVPRHLAVKKLTEGWYNHLLTMNNGFLKEIAAYKKNLSNIMLALNGRKHEIPYEDALIGDDDITRSIKKSRARDLGLSHEINNIETLVQTFEMDNILERELRIDSLIWNFLDEATFFNYFTIERILAFIQKLFIAERWNKLDKEKGQEIFKQLLEELQSNFEFPEEFAITYGKRK